MKKPDGFLHPFVSGGKACIHSNWLCLLLQDFYSFSEWGNLRDLIMLVMSWTTLALIVICSLGSIPAKRYMRP